MDIPLNSVYPRVSVDLLLQKVGSYLPDPELKLIQRAYNFASNAHHNQFRSSGEPYSHHLLLTALILADLRLDSTTLSAALLHDVIEDTSETYDSIAKEFGTPMADLVDGVTKLSRMKWGDHEEWQAESLSKMFLAMARDIRVVMIKLADRLHNMRTLRALGSDKQLRIARETMDI